MATELLTDKYRDVLDGVLNCYDRIIVTGSLPPLCYAHGMTKYLYVHDIRIFDYAQFAKPLTEQIRAKAEEIARAHGLEIEFIRKKNFRQEARIKKILEQRGDHPGLVHIFSAMERCDSYKPWHDKTTGKTYVKRDSGKCLHYYFYFIVIDPKNWTICKMKIYSIMEHMGGQLCLKENGTARSSSFKSLWMQPRAPKHSMS
jgi:hypothetical protein